MLCETRARKHGAVSGNGSPHLDLRCELIPATSTRSPSPACSCPERVEAARASDLCCDASCTHFRFSKPLFNPLHRIISPASSHRSSHRFAHSAPDDARSGLHLQYHREIFFQSTKTFGSEHTSGTSQPCVTQSTSSHFSPRQPTLSKSRTSNPSYPPCQSPSPTTFHPSSTTRPRKRSNRRLHSHISLTTFSEDKTATPARRATITAGTSALQACAVLQAQDAALILPGTSRAARWARLALAASEELLRLGRQTAKAVSRRRRLPAQESRDFWSARAQHKALLLRVAAMTA